MMGNEFECNHKIQVQVSVTLVTIVGWNVSCRGRLQNKFEL